MLSVKQLHILMYLPDKQDILWISYISEGPVTGWGYKREGMITNLPLYLAGKTKKLLEWTCVRGRLFTVPLVQPLLSMSQWFHWSIFPLEKQLKSNEMLRIPFSDSRNEIYKKRAVCSSYSAAEKKPEKKDISCTCGWKNICTITFCFYMIRGCHQQTMKQKDSLEVIRESSRLCLFEIQRASGISVKAWACLLRYGKNMTMYLRRCLRSLNKETDGSD